MGVTVIDIPITANAVDEASNARIVSLFLMIFFKERPLSVLFLSFFCNEVLSSFSSDTIPNASMLSKTIEK